MNGRVTLRPVVTCFLVVACVFFAADIALKSGHRTLGTVLFLVAAAPVLGGCLVIIVYDALVPALPVCGSGRCRKFKHYTYVRESHDGVIYRCRCGTEYVERRDKDAVRFMEVCSDGSVRPYMKHKRWGRWTPDAAGNSD